MQIVQCAGFELEKELKNSPEDYFNRSEVTYLDKGKEKVFSLLYVRYFGEDLSTFTPYENDPIFQIEERSVFLKDVVGLIALIKKPGYKNRKRVYVNEEEEFRELFSGLQWEKVKEVFTIIENGQLFDLESTLEFIQA